MDIIHRFAEAERYLSLTNDVRQEQWRRLAKTALAKKDLAVALALVRPEILTSSVSDPPDYQGPRHFTKPTPSSVQTCESEIYWGIPCSLAAGLHADHSWPYALGGPTDPENLTWLCGMHNLAKGSDIHCWPWETTSLPSWVASVLRTCTRD